MKIVITGATGFIGSNLHATLLANGHNIVALAHFSSPDNQLGLYKTGDLFDINWQEIMEWQPDILIHLAGPASVAKSFQDFYIETKNSILLTTFILEKLRQKPGTRFLYFSSAAVYGNHQVERYSESLSCHPVSPYGVCKYASEQMIKIAADKFGLDYAIVRPFSIYGPGLKKQVIYDLTMRFLKNENPLVIHSTGNELRDFVHINDCCSIVNELVKWISWGGLTLNIGTGKAVSIKTLVNNIAKITNSSCEYVFACKDNPGNPLSLVADITKLTNYGFCCKTNLEEGLLSTISDTNKMINN